MPNHCENDLTVGGKVDEIRKFLEFAKGENGELDFNKFIPYPKRFKEMDEARKKWEEENNELGSGNEDCPKDGYNSGGYEWCWDNWGTKWNAYDIGIEPFQKWGEGDGKITIHFDSAWSPPEPVIEKMGEMFPDLAFELRYFESGYEFNGILYIKNGKIEHRARGDYFGYRGG